MQTCGYDLQSIYEIHAPNCVGGFLQKMRGRLLFFIKKYQAKNAEPQLRTYSLIKTVKLLHINILNSFVNRLGKLPSKEQQLSRTQHFILSSHAAMFVLHTQYGPCGIPLTPELSPINTFIDCVLLFLSGEGHQDQSYRV